MKIFLSATEHGSGELAVKKLLRESEMKIFLSTGEMPSRQDVMESLIASTPNCPALLWNLVSYYYMRNNETTGTLVRDNSREIMVDSGAFSIQQGAKANYDSYVKDYANFIQQWDRPNVIGFFEMDIDKIVGYDRVLSYRRQLEKVSDKIIPVWHPNRGIKGFVEMCEEYSGRIVAISGFSREDIKDNDFIKFLKTAHDHDCKMHCLGMTRKNILDKVPFDFVDSASWVMSTVYGRVGQHPKKIARSFEKTNRSDIYAYAYTEGMRMQMHYYQKWRHVCKD